MSLQKQKMQEQKQQHQISFLSKRRQLLLQNLRNRRQQVFNQARQLLSITQNLTIIPNTNQAQQQKHQQSIENNSYFHKIYQEAGQSAHLSEQTIKQPRKEIQQGSKKTRKNPHNKHQFYKNFQFPQWLTYIPKNTKNYYFSLRPFGEKVFIHLLRRKMLVISMYGHVIEALAVTKQQYNNSLFEGYYMRTSEEKNSNKRVLVICDMLVWKQNPMTCSEFQFRIMWMINNFGQGVIKGLLSNDAGKGIDIRIMEFKAVEENSVTQGWVNRESRMGYRVDGILFYEKDGYYHQGVNPDVVFWKDPLYLNISCQSQLNSLTLKQQGLNQTHKSLSFFGLLNYQQDNILYTLDGIPLTRIDLLDIEGFTKNWQQKPQKQNKWIVRFTFDHINQNPHENINQEINQLENKKHIFFPFNLINFKIVSVHGLNHRIPDPLSKILWKFHYLQGVAINFQTLIATIHQQQQLNINDIIHKQAMDVE